MHIFLGEIREPKNGGFIWAIFCLDSWENCGRFVMCVFYFSRLVFTCFEWENQSLFIVTLPFLGVRRVMWSLLC